MRPCAPPADFNHFVAELATLPICGAKPAKSRV
jgi:hypothetical protein